MDQRKNFKPGERVLFRDDPHSPTPSHFASMTNDLVMHLNAKDANGKVLPISGTILGVRFTDAENGDEYDFAPDGWVSNPSGWPRGFAIHERYLERYNGDPIPGTVIFRDPRKR